jgi:capsular polysaccharide biosynthesis protein/cellulose biosynthesis protein BcsQ
MTMQPGADYFELADYAGVLRRRWLTVLGFTLIGVALAGAYYYVAPRSYAATVLVQVNALQTTANALGGRTSGPVNMDNENQIVQSAAVAAIAKSQLKSPLSVTGLLKEIKVTVPPNTTFLQITCGASSADLAERCANAFGRAYLYNRRATALNLITSGINELEKQANGLETSIETLRAKTGRHGLPAGSAARGVAELELTAKLARLATIQSKISSATPLEANLAAKNTAVGEIVTPATKPTAPVSPKKKLLLPSGLAAGLVLGLALAFFVDWRRPRIRSARDIQRRADLPTVFSLLDAANGDQAVFAPPRSPAGQLFTEVAQYAGAALGDGHHILLVTGTGQGSGGSGSGGTIAANLAAALARTRGDTVLIYADPRGSRLLRLPGIPNGRGFAELLAGTATIADVTHGIADLPSLAVITPGLGAGAGFNLRHDVVQQIMRELRRSARYVVIDVPPPEVDVDTFSLAEFADAAILTVPAGTTRPADVTNCLQRLERMRTAILAALLVPPGRRLSTDRSRRAEFAADEPAPRASYARTAQPQPWPSSRDEPSSPREPVIRPVARRTSEPGGSPNGGSRHAAPSRPAETPASNAGSSGFASAWMPRSVSETWPLPPTSRADEDEEANFSDPRIGN